MTKKMLKDIRKRLLNRLNEVCRLNDIELKLEYERMFPKSESDNLSEKEMIRTIMYWAIESNIPEHMVS
jgi:hypothetical protein